MRKCNRSFRPLAAVFAAVSSVAVPALADTPITQFTPGDYLIMRGGDPTNSDNNSAPDYDGEVNAYIDEYSQAGYYVGTLPLPAMTIPGGGGNSIHEGNLDISPNGQWIAFAGYDPNTDGPGTSASPVGLTEHAEDGSETAVVGEINLAEGPSSLNTSTLIPGSSSYPNNLTGQFVHSAMTLDGNEFYIGGKYNQTANGDLETNDTGLLYINGVGPSANITVLEGGTDWRNILAFNGQLYGATGSSSVGAHGLYTIGTGLPTSNNPIPAHTIITNYPGGQSASSFGFADISTSDSSAGTSNGFNVLYTDGDQSASGVTKYYYDPVNQVWNHAGNQVTLTANNNISVPFGIVATVDPTNPAWVDLTVSGENGVYSYIDKSGDPETALTSETFTQLITPPTYASFYGMTQDPGPVNLVWGNSGNGQTWDVGASSNWTYGGASAKFANQENVTFDDTSNNTAPISLNSVVEPGSITVNASVNNYTITGTGSIGGSGALRLLPGNTSTFTLDTSNSYTGGTTINGGTLVIGAAGALPAGGVVVNNATLNVEANSVAGNVSGTGTLNIGASTLLKLSPSTGPDTQGTLNISGGSTLDLTNNSLAINFGSNPDPVATIRSYLASGYKNGAWNGSGIDSSSAASSGGKFAVGYLDANDPGGTAGQIVLKYALVGDANLDGTVNLTDLLALLNNYGESNRDWAAGDFNYDSTVNLTDLLALLNNYGQSSSSTGASLNSARVVPEPASISLVFGAAMGLMMRRRRD